MPLANATEYPKIKNQDELIGDEFYWLAVKGSNNLITAHVMLGNFSVGKEMIPFEEGFEIYNVYGPIPKPKVPDLWERTVESDSK